MPTTRGRMPVECADPRRARRNPALPGRSRSRLRAVGGSSCWPWSRETRLGGRHALFQRDRQLHRAAVRDRDHGARLDAHRSSASPKPRCDTWQMPAAARPGRGGLTILDVGPLLGSLITEPAAMTICALLLARQFYDLEPRTAEVRDARAALRQRVDRRHADAFAAPPVLMVARPWGWTTAFMLTHFGWRALVAILVSTARLLPVVPPRAPPGLATLHAASGRRTAGRGSRRRATYCCRCPPWIIVVHLRIHGVDGRQRPPPGAVPRWLPVLPRLRARHGRVTKAASSCARHCWSDSSWPVSLSTAGCRAGGSRPCSPHCERDPLFVAASILTAFNDNALITYLATLVPNLDDGMKSASSRAL